MRKAIGTAIALSCCLMAGDAQAAQSSKSTTRQARVIPAALSLTRPSISRSQIAVCANLAGVRVLEARAKGAGYAAQDRILDAAFLLCLAGPPIEG